MSTTDRYTKTEQAFRHAITAMLTTCVDIVDPASAITQDLLWAAADSRMWDRMVQHQIEREFDLSTSSDPKVEYLLSELMSKSDALDLGINRLDAALEGFYESESACASTNRRLLYTRGAPDIMGTPVAVVIYRLQRKISRVLGDFSWDDAIRFCGFGPGANVGLPRRNASLTNKIGLISPTVTEGCLDLATTALRYFEGWGAYAEKFAYVPRVVKGNKVVTVPKNYKTDRVIAIEPFWNSFFQKGIGGLIRRSLKRVGIDLDDQSSNQRAAYSGSVDGRLATVDLKRASDSISRGICELLLPQDWLAAIAMTRSEVGVLPSDVVHYQKISSMGNGFTFELESLLFWAISELSHELTGVHDRVLVYGDDIVVDRRAVPVLSALLGYFGFEMNQKKSHWGEGPGFRESCGKHFYRGMDITPIYVRHGLKTDHERALFMNNVLRWSARGHGPFAYKDSRFRPIASIAQSLAPTRVLRCLIPDGYGDGGLVADFDEACPSRSRKGWDGWITRHCPEVLVDRRGFAVEGSASYLSRLFELDRYGAGVPESMHSSMPKVLSKATRSLFIRSQWPNLGPWKAYDYMDVALPTELRESFIPVFWGRNPPPCGG